MGAAALAGEPEYEEYYRIFPDRTMPDAYERTTREIFPDDHPGSFVQLPDGRWIWSTFYSFQWDLNYANPAVFAAMAGEMLFLANVGVEVLRMDAVAFIWKELGTTCESLPQAHTLLQAFNAVCRIAAPAVVFKSEAIVHPDEVVQYIAPGECQLSYNPLQMALTWEALATRDATLLSQALERRHAIDPACAWVNYVRSHDDIGWTFADEDAAELGIDGFQHRRFLNAFYVGRFPGSFARGVPFQENPRTGDAASPARRRRSPAWSPGSPGLRSASCSRTPIALSTGGIPLLYLGDEVGQLNDYGYLADPDRAGDSRWVHRPPYPAERYAERNDPDTDAGTIYRGTPAARRGPPSVGRAGRGRPGRLPHPQPARARLPAAGRSRHRPGARERVGRPAGRARRGALVDARIRRGPHHRGRHHALGRPRARAARVPLAAGLASPPAPFGSPRSRPGT